jgi:hypothetical protein
VDINSVTVFLVQSGLSFAVLVLLIYWFIAPYLAAQPIRKAMLVLLAPHICHHVGLAVLIPGVVGIGFPPDFARIIAIGEPIMLVLAMACMGTLRSGSALTPLLLWLFTISGFAYNFIAAWVGISLGSSLVDKLDAHWYVSVFYVPLLFMSHVLVLINLLKRGHELRELKGQMAVAKARSV